MINSRASLLILIGLRKLRALEHGCVKSPQIGDKLLIGSEYEEPANPGPLLPAPYYGSSADA